MADVVETSILDVIEGMHIVSGIAKASGKPYKGLKFRTKGGYEKMFFIPDEGIFIIERELKDFNAEAGKLDLTED